MENKLFELIAEWHAWADEKFPDETFYSAHLHLTEEIQELLEDYKHWEKELSWSGMGPDSNTFCQEEFADCFMLFMRCMKQLRINKEDLIYAIQAKLDKNMKRTWIQDAEGNWRHEK